MSTISSSERPATIVLSPAMCVPRKPERPPAPPCRRLSRSAPQTRRDAAYARQHRLQSLMPRPPPLPLLLAVPWIITITRPPPAKTPQHQQPPPPLATTPVHGSSPSPDKATASSTIGSSGTCPILQTAMFNSLIPAPRGMTTLSQLPTDRRS